MLALIGACKAEPHRRDAAAAVPPSAPPSSTAARVAQVRDASVEQAADPANRITLSIARAKPAGSGLARHCTLSGDPIANDCKRQGGSLTLDREGRLYVVAGSEVRRYRRAAAPAGDDARECRFEAAGPAVALPVEPVRAQRIDGPVYMRSGGADWQLATVGDAVFAFDFLAGLYRIDRGKSEPLCVDVFGYGSIAALGGKLVIGRHGLERLALGRPCRASSANIDDQGRGAVHVIRDHVYTTEITSIARYAGKTRIPLAEGTRLCGIVALEPCGEGVCAFDNNCMQVIQLGADDKVVRSIPGDRLFDARPYSLRSAATERDGGIVLLTTQRDVVGGTEVCEAAIYELPAALFGL